MTVNPKKLRPYDQPRRRRIKLIPDGPDSAAIGFLVAAALWLAMASALGALAIGLRIVPFEFSFPLYLFGWEFTFDPVRVDYAFVNATVYGWLSNAGFAAVLFMTPRLLGLRLSFEKVAMLGLAAWNSALAGGIAGLYVFDLGPNAPLTALLWLFDGGLATGALFVGVAFLATAVTGLRRSYLSVWFGGMALLSIMGLTGVIALLGLGEWLLNLDDLFVALASVFIERAILTLWLLGVAYAALHYAVPRATGQPLASLGLGLLTFLTWLALAPLSAVGTLVDPTIPYAITTLGQVGTMLLLVPASLAAVNLAMTMQGRWTLVFGTGTASFAVVALAFLLATSLLDAIASLRSVHVFVALTDWQDGAFTWWAFGTITFALLSLADHALPRMLRRAWSGGLVSASVLWLAFSGVTIAGLALMGGGLAEASLLSQGTAPDAMGEQLLVYRAAAFGGAGIIALAGLAFLVNIFLMYTSGDPAEYVVPGGAAAAPAGH